MAKIQPVLTRNSWIYDHVKLDLCKRGVAEDVKTKHFSLLFLSLPDDHPSHPDLIYTIEEYHRSRRVWLDRIFYSNTNGAVQYTSRPKKPPLVSLFHLCPWRLSGTRHGRNPDKQFRANQDAGKEHPDSIFSDEYQTDGCSLSAGFV